MPARRFDRKKKNRQNAANDPNAMNAPQGGGPVNTPTATNAPQVGQPANTANAGNILGGGGPVNSPTTTDAPLGGQPVNTANAGNALKGDQPVNTPNATNPPADDQSVNTANSTNTPQGDQPVFNTPDATNVPEGGQPVNTPNPTNALEVGEAVNIPNSTEGQEAGNTLTSAEGEELADASINSKGKGPADASNNSKGQEAANTLNNAEGEELADASINSKGKEPADASNNSEGVEKPLRSWEVEGRRQKAKKIQVKTLEDEVKGLKDELATKNKNLGFAENQITALKQEITALTRNANNEVEGLESKNFELDQQVANTMSNAEKQAQEAYAEKLWTTEVERNWYSMKDQLAAEILAKDEAQRKLRDAERTKTTFTAQVSSLEKGKTEFRNKIKGLEEQLTKVNAVNAKQKAELELKAELSMADDELISDMKLHIEELEIANQHWMNTAQGLEADALRSNNDLLGVENRLAETQVAPRTLDQELLDIGEYEDGLSDALETQSETGTKLASMAALEMISQGTQTDVATELAFPATISSGTQTDVATELALPATMSSGTQTDTATELAFPATMSSGTQTDAAEELALPDMTTSGTQTDENMVVETEAVNRGTQTEPETTDIPVPTPTTASGPQMSWLTYLMNGRTILLGVVLLVLIMASCWAWSQGSAAMQEREMWTAANGRAYRLAEENLRKQAVAMLQMVPKNHHGSLGYLTPQKLKGGPSLPIMARKFVPGAPPGALFAY